MLNGFIKLKHFTAGLVSFSFYVKEKFYVAVTVALCWKATVMCGACSCLHVRPLLLLNPIHCGDGMK